MRNAKAIYTIWLRDLIRFSRERSRIVGLLGQPLLYLLIVGNGFASSFHLPYAPPGTSYLQFMYPGIIGMSVLFTAVFSGISIVWDREFGFLKEVLVAPVPRWTVAIGKTLGGSTVAMIQAAILLILAPFVGVHLSPQIVPAILGILFLIAFALTSFGIFVASRMQSMEGFQMIMNFLIMPLFFLSGALFPLRGLPAWMGYLMRIDPLTYGVDALRNVLFASGPLRAVFVQFPIHVDLLVVTGMALVLVGAATIGFNRQT
ncbi:MAG: ABC transporter permease [Peptococcaceae bacterium]|jgi:ABC-2 type transport system permease protein|nr:ABC transporter permease [Peptococcaceae bacterium]